ncbi:hypothetical protein [Amycolatopsis saalfeldensis]|uniref:Uncharacterized protein n=1 Tax=Amycolatopsis saalfeldensis TaxID=394193 RepID=A0A1H8Y3B3_9PSEU|nr:hypothetical protein [Amycolatopsis saalfeldensis]SEP46562.1 hypothetical protein SAMN04489732_110285 [Amycolatopsis saalfeldensis]
MSSRLQRARRDLSMRTHDVHRDARELLIAAALDLAEGIDAYALPDTVYIGHLQSDDFDYSRGDPEPWPAARVRARLDTISAALGRAGDLLDAIDTAPSRLTPAAAGMTVHEAAERLDITAQQALEDAITGQLGVPADLLDDLLGRYQYLPVDTGSHPRRARGIHAGRCDGGRGAARTWWHALETYAGIHPERLSAVVELLTTGPEG